MSQPQEESDYERDGFVVDDDDVEEFDPEAYDSKDEELGEEWDDSDYDPGYDDDGDEDYEPGDSECEGCEELTAEVEALKQQLELHKRVLNIAMARCTCGGLRAAASQVMNSPGV